MRRFPLSAKIMVWFFGNLALLTVVGWLLIEVAFALSSATRLYREEKEELPK